MDEAIDEWTERTIAEACDEEYIPTSRICGSCGGEVTTKRSLLCHNCVIKIAKNEGIIKKEEWEAQNVKHNCF